MEVNTDFRPAAMKEPKATPAKGRRTGFWTTVHLWMKEGWLAKRKHMGSWSTVQQWMREGRLQRVAVENCECDPNGTAAPRPPQLPQARPQDEIGDPSLLPAGRERQEAGLPATGMRRRSWGGEIESDDNPTAQAPVHRSTEVERDEMDGRIGGSPVDYLRNLAVALIAWIIYWLCRLYDIVEGRVYHGAEGRDTVGSSARGVPLEAEFDEWEGDPIDGHVGEEHCESEDSEPPGEDSSPPSGEDRRQASTKEPCENLDDTDTSQPDASTLLVESPLKSHGSHPKGGNKGGKPDFKFDTPVESSDEMATMKQTVKRITAEHVEEIAVAVCKVIEDSDQPSAVKDDTGKAGKRTNNAEEAPTGPRNTASLPNSSATAHGRRKVPEEQKVLENQSNSVSDQAVQTEELGHDRGEPHGKEKDEQQADQTGQPAEPFLSATADGHSRPSVTLNSGQPPSTSVQQLAQDAVGNTGKQRDHCQETADREDSEQDGAMFDAHVPEQHPQSVGQNDGQLRHDDVHSKESEETPESGASRNPVEQYDAAENIPTEEDTQAAQQSAASLQPGPDQRRNTTTGAEASMPEPATANQRDEADPDLGTPHTEAEPHSAHHVQEESAGPTGYLPSQGHGHRPTDNLTPQGQGHSPTGNTLPQGQSYSPTDDPPSQDQGHRHTDDLPPQSQGHGPTGNTPPQGHGHSPTDDLTPHDPNHRHTDDLTPQGHGHRPTGDPPPQGHGHRSSGSSPPQGHGHSSTGDPPSQAANHRPTDDLPSQGQGHSPTGNTPPQSQGHSPTGNTPPQGQGHSPNDDLPPHGYGRSPTGDLPPQGHGQRPNGDPPTHGHGRTPIGDPPTQGQGHSPTGNTPPQSHGHSPNDDLPPQGHGRSPTGDLPPQAHGHRPNGDPPPEDPDVQEMGPGGEPPAGQPGSPGGRPLAGAVVETWRGARGPDWGVSGGYPVVDLREYYVDQHCTDDAPRARDYLPELVGLRRLSTSSRDSGEGPGTGAADASDGDDLMEELRQRFRPPPQQRGGRRFRGGGGGQLPTWCVRCREVQADTVLLNCHHTVLCRGCALSGMRGSHNGGGGGGVCPLAQCRSPVLCFLWLG
ncbi:uncharacterized protein LOC143297816 [Babylonia areolata]|uniref:uncharacterized protein LOC143297816 n=1 Tax=Babylonia areolata TaxID=304850 RepID=UPI003FD3B5EA